MEKYKQLTSLAKKRKSTSTVPLSSSTPPSSTSKQLKLTDVTIRKPSQAAVDKHLIELICQGLLPFRMVELPAFRKFVEVLQPGVHVISRPTVKRKLALEAESIKMKIKKAVSSIEYVATTTDCWTARRRSFIGLTAHWIDPTTLKRHSAALACKRLKGSHTFDVLASAIDEIHASFGIRDKVIKPTTDNGSNFLKAFSVRQFQRNISTCGSDVDFAGSSSEFERPSSDADSDTEEIATEIQYEDAFSMIETSTSFTYKLPHHQRCACHILHLSACKDTANADRDVTFKKLYRSTFAKLSALWNRSSRSTAAAEIMEETCGRQLIRPCKTRWNSFYLAFERIVTIRKEKGEEPLNQVFRLFNIQM